LHGGTEPCHHQTNHATPRLIDLTNNRNNTGKETTRASAAKARARGDSSAIARVSQVRRHYHAPHAIRKTKNCSALHDVSVMALGGAVDSFINNVLNFSLARRS
jgi:hypothetical protein